MIDLKKLEQMLQEALDKETPESLRRWLKKHRGNDYYFRKINRYGKEFSEKPKRTFR